MRHAIIGVILAGALGWTVFSYFHLMAPPPWRNWLPAVIANNDLILILLLFGALIIGVTWDRYRKAR